ncbi:MAG: hypothetical protein WC761_01225 [Candidatus Paceibacterota bacterium]
MTDTDGTLSIGQVIYVLSNKAQKIVPAIVVEEVVVKKMDGNHISWKVSVGPAGKEKVIDSSRLDGDIYKSLEEIREVLHKRLATFLDELVNEAGRRVELWYGPQMAQMTPSQKGESELDKIDPENLISAIENDQPAAHSMPRSLTVSPTQGQLELRRRAEAMADPDVKFPGATHTAPDGSEEIILPGGHRVKVNLKGMS